MSNSSYLTVKALTKYIKRKFDADPHLREVYVKGELSNVKMHSSGHIYFTLKDDAARIQATMFRTAAAKLAFKPEEGMMVYIRGDVNIYETAGIYQLYVQTMEPDGIGGLFIAFQQLKETLQREGLFNPNFKQAIPPFPKAIGVLTATTGAAIRDICTTIQRRYPQAEICIYPTLVQGAGAAANIAKNIQLANRHAQCDVLIVGRGGGSIEDLWAFNEEIVARAIFESRIPIISAVGHETDTTIADFVADLRAPTPTAAAELAVPNQHELKERITTNVARLQQIVTAQLRFERNRLQKYQQAYPLATPEKLYRPFIERLAHTDMKLQQAMQVYMLKKRNEAEKTFAKMQFFSPQKSIQMEQQKLAQLHNELNRAVQYRLNEGKSQLHSTIRTLAALNPLAMMEKGFNLTYREDQVIKEAAQLALDDAIEIHYQDGIVRAKVMDIELQKGE
ncbi:exodeoxyribonuclease VII large subunit [Metasolibacillus sp.]|uniref:exodeoxyribonuclease VII large subunit n=1 Tax=Metasolibacillus sp. TaxID=2703680 RepID=UPI0025DC7552|nr:exodeoxyribonuclease VII large subunit [Metasolibacillus sp.]MCT6922989.1 exodeoxyribonuclease VII large subunit [Metasolibacillus sp.]MCT6939227.1 exodeoxyribonuclease VII large subunit [Metasolibacillus sp.]